MAAHSTAEILAMRFLGESVDQRFVDWAAAQLAQGLDSPHLRILAGAPPPFDDHELSEVLDRILDELQLEPPRELNHEVLVASVGIAEYREACEAARADAAREDYGRGFPTFDSYIAHDLDDRVWDSELPVSSKLGLAFGLYEDMPSSAFLMCLYFRYSDLPEREQELFWDWIRAQLSSEDPALRAPVAYSLWCDWFEDPAMVDVAWSELARTDAPDRVLQEALVSSGPVPFRLKSALYDELLPEQRWHYYIFQSLLHSQFDVYGKIDKREARRIFKKLRLPPKTEHVAKLRAALRWYA